jgi:metal-responsive CopG/Arc/MetJ family transcriptional regulator
MKEFTKHIRIRITEQQFKNLADLLVEEQKSKSAIIRDALNKYLVGHNSTNEIQKERKKTTT